MSSALIDAPHLPERVAEFRQRYRETVVGAFYNGWLHLGFVVVGSLSIIGIALRNLGYDASGNVKAVQPEQWLAIPATLLISNVIEYLGHRGPMHHYRPMRFLALLFHRHTEEHHQFFTNDWMTCRSPRDYKIVLFPPIMLFTYLGLVALPAGVICYYFADQNVACLAVASSMFYFLSYEVLHFTYHVDENTWIGRMWMVRVLREHHRIHHDQQLMTKYNFNITWPVADYLFGTVYNGPKEPPAERMLAAVGKTVQPEAAVDDAANETELQTPVTSAM